jgi:hypothetical protein
MRSAPSVRYPVGRSAFYGFLLAVLCLVGMLAVVLAAVWDGPMSGSGLGVAWLLWSAGASWAWVRQPQGKLTWDASAVPSVGEPSRGAWSWSSLAYQEGVELSRVERVYDFQVAVLVRLYNPDGAQSWVWVERHTDPGHWDDLRRALWAHA